MSNAIQSYNFKSICSEMYGKEDHFTKAIKSAMQNPKAKVKYNGKRWTYQKKGIKTSILDRLIHKIRFCLSKAYQRKFRKASESLFHALKVYQIRPDHSLQVMEVNKLEKNRIFYDESLDQLKIKKEALHAQGEKIKTELEAANLSLEKYCVENSIAQPPPINNKYFEEIKVLKKVGITEEFLAEYKEINEKIAKLKEEIQQSLLKKDINKLEKQKLELNKLSHQQAGIDRKFHHTDFPPQFKNMTPVAIEDYLGTLQSELPQNKLYTGYKKTIARLQASQTECTEELAKINTLLQGAEEKKQQFKKEIESYIDTVVPNPKVI